MRIIFARSVVLVAFTVISGCDQQPDPPSSSPPPSSSSSSSASSSSCDMKSKDVGCTSAHCGGNSPVINQFPINGLHSDGCKNLQGLSLDRESFRPAPQSNQMSTCRGTDLTLVASGDQLAAKGSHSNECSEQELVGGVFSITSQPEGAPKQRLLVKITDLAMIPMAGGADSVPAYLFTTVDSNAPLCRAEVGMAWQHSQPTLSPAPMIEPSLADYAVIMTNGKVYNEKGQPIPGSENGWFNIACADDALAKIRLYGMDKNRRTSSGEWLQPPGAADYKLEIVPYPGENPYSPAGQHAALNMLTANYCGTAKHYTRHGIKIGWPSKSGMKPESAPKPPTCTKASLEALWGEHGAVCVCRSRLWLSDTLVPSDRLPENGESAGGKSKGCKNGRCTEQQFLDQIEECSEPKRKIPSCDKLSQKHDPIFWESDLQDHLLKIQ